MRGSYPSNTVKKGREAAWTDMKKFVCLPPDEKIG